MAGLRDDDSCAGLRKLLADIGVGGSPAEEIQKRHSILLRAGSWSSTTKQNRQNSTALAALTMHHACPDTIVTTEQDDFDEQVERSWSSRVWVKPGAFFRPHNASEVSIGLRIARYFHTRFSIRSGGHSPLQSLGDAASQDYIVFSLERLNGIKLYSSTLFAEVGTGCRWGEVYRALEPADLAVSGGHYADVGVGGYMQGGGSSFFLGSHGWSCDTVRNFEVVLSDGRIVNANEESHPDLYWALKGGASNFGIVTRYGMDTIPLSPTSSWGGNLIYDSSQVGASIAAIAEMQSNSHETDPVADVAFLVLKEPCTGLDIAAAALFHPNHSVEEAHHPKVLDPLFNVPATRDTTRIQPLAKMAEEAGAGLIFKKGNRYNYGQITVGVDAKLYAAIYERWRVHYASLETIPGICLTLSYNPIPAKAIVASRTRGSNPFGIKEIAQCRIGLDHGWTRAEDDEKVLAADVAFLNDIADLARSYGLLQEYIGMNNAGEHQDVMGHYGKENLERMRNVSRKYDVDQVFQELCAGPFKLMKRN
ncbi:uncharacterized protein RCC_07863 [Ramularia collo-cygni]|uniref:FAD-binding PCMH-type domain-containing protein n=1 Tax=Ramularia collo-cygni TaxID=112498 RepID=A0A2D3VGF8_9PEZI|nr:uncharacterized protein RCC_07863 [Ramularia collo-cygni]CZT21994.1 uncharacterized protein RCC_07863 [Ramularia collo-cygni]